jgi:hypothetical protein
MPDTVDPSAVMTVEDALAFNHVIFKSSFEGFTVGELKCTFTVFEVFVEITYITQWLPS